MDRTDLIEEIIRRVTEKLNAMEQDVPDAVPNSVCESKPGLLVLAPEHGADCHSLLENEAVKAKYRIDCALLHQYEVDLTGYETVVLYGLSCGALAALSCGVCGCAYTRLAAQAILLGKRVLIPAEEVELYQYKETAPVAYYQAFQEKLRLLTDSGVVVCAGSELEQLLLEQPDARQKPVPAPRAAVPEPSACPPPSVDLCVDICIDKRVLTERDVIAAGNSGAMRVCVNQKCIITALARDAAETKGITIIRKEG